MAKRDHADLSNTNSTTTSYYNTEDVTCAWQ